MQAVYPSKFKKKQNTLIKFITNNVRIWMIEFQRPYPPKRRKMRRMKTPPPHKAHHKNMQ